MNKVIIINLNGTAYNLEEGGYTKLQTYLENAAKELAENPDKDEIIADLEQAIGEKCQKVLTSHKTVVMEMEVDQILVEMGPVDATQAASTEEEVKEKESTEGAPKRFYLIREGSFIAGVCTGLAAYFNIDVAWVRVGYIILFWINAILGILAYVIPMLIVPYAKTGEERAAARGKPFNAQELVDKARAEYEKINKTDWKKWGKDVGQNANASWGQAQKNWKEKAPYAVQVTSRFGVVISMILIMILTLGLFYALFTLITTGAVLGFAFTGVPMWVSIIILICAYNILLWPLRAIHQSSTGRSFYDANGWYGMWDGFMWMGVIAVSLWATYTYVPGASEFIQGLPIWK